MVSSRVKARGTLNLSEELPIGIGACDKYEGKLSRNILRKLLRKWKIVLLVLWTIAFLVMTLAILSRYKDTFISKLEQLSQWTRDRGLFGGVVLTLLITCTGFPPIFGLGTLTTFSGFVYGFPLGFVPAFIGAFVGGSSCFMLCRKYGHTYVRRILTSHHIMANITQAIEKKGFKLFLLIRFAPYPYNVLNATLAGTTIPTTQFLIVTAISLVKLLPSIYIGSQLISFTDALTQHPSPLKIFGLVLAATLGIGVVVYLYWLSKKLVNEVVHEGEEQDGLVSRSRDHDSMWVLESRSSEEV
ncbi:Tlg2-vesicle protein [Basidiobolus ranarum]|uniref:Golgi apparatus membrane protein TVP38 n=1 Tax=Basidiobolus ranarum TaxID=34480 RepID=A0ABR2WUC1_9FUNG